jgi:hypothetical protein
MFVFSYFSHNRDERSSSELFQNQIQLSNVKIAYGKVLVDTSPTCFRGQILCRPCLLFLKRDMKEIGLNNFKIKFNSPMSKWPQFIHSLFGKTEKVSAII